MSVYVCAVDESADENPQDQFFYGGFVALEEDWESIEAEWRRHVLESPPDIPRTSPSRSHTMAPAYS
jgi:hypothetical protein